MPRTNNNDIRKYYMSVRTKFYNYKERLKCVGQNIDFTAISEILSFRYAAVGLSNIDMRSIRGLFNKDDSSAINLPLAIAVCNILGMNIYSTFQFDKDLISYSPNSTNFYNDIIKSDKNTDNHIKFLRHKLYNGEYKCYFFVPKVIGVENVAGKSHANYSIIQNADLTIKTEEGVTVAEFYNHQTGLSLKGTVVYLPRQQKVYINFSEKEGKEFIWILFDYLDLKQKSLIYKSAIMMTSSSSDFEPSVPYVQKMLICSKDNCFLEEEIIRGLLVFNTNEIIVDDEKLMELCKQYPILYKLKEHKKKSLYYKFNEAEILCDDKYNLTLHNKLELLLNLARESENNTQVYVKDPYGMECMF